MVVSGPGGSFSPGTVINPSLTQAVSAPCADNDGGLSGIALRFPWTVKVNVNVQLEEDGDNPDLSDPEG